MVNMDPLIAQTVRPLEDEKTELFHLMDRFDASICQIQEEFQQLEEKGKEELNFIQISFEREMNRLESDRKTKLSEENAKLDSAKKNYEAKKSAAEKGEYAAVDGAKRQVNQKRLKDESELSKQERDVEAYLKSRAELGNFIDERLAAMKKIMGVDFNNKSEFDKMTSSMKIPAMVINSVAEAEKYTDSVNRKKVLDNYTIFETITMSILKSAFQKRKREAAVREILIMKANAEAAYAYLTAWKNSEVETKRKQNVVNLDNYNKQLNEIQAREKAKREQNIKACENEWNRKQNEYHKQVTVIENEYQNKKNILTQKKNKDIPECIAKWKKKMAEIGKIKISEMATMYPPERMNQWLKQFWNHPRLVEQYNSLPDSTSLNAIIGVAYISIKSWYTELTSVIMAEILKGYPYLFGEETNQRNTNWKRQMIVLPYSVSIEKGTSLLICHNAQSETSAQKMLNGIAMRMLRSVPANLMRFRLLSGVNMGVFVDLKSLDPANPQLVQSGDPDIKSIIISEANGPDRIKQSLNEMENEFSGIESLLGNYPSIRDFNEKNPLSKQNYRVLLAANFPSGLEKEELKRVNRFISSCMKIGFSFVATQSDRDTDFLKDESEAAFREIEKRIQRLRINPAGNYLNVLGGNSGMERKACIYPYGLPDNEDVKKEIIRCIRQRSVSASQKKILFGGSQGVCPADHELFRGNASGGIVVPLGYENNGLPFKLQFDNTHINTMILGETRSGKSNVLHVLMTNLMLRYRKEDVEIYLIDYKYGMDDKIYAQYNLPYFKMIGINPDPEFVWLVLERISDEMRARAQKMGIIHNLSNYNNLNPDKKMSRIFVIIDELYVMVQKAGEEVGRKIMHKLNELAPHIGATGIHLILAGQNLSTLEYFSTISSQCINKMALYSKNIVSGFMEDAATDKIRQIDSADKGSCVFSVESGRNTGIEHTVLLEEAEHKKYLKLIHDKYLKEHILTDARILLNSIQDNPNHPLQLFAESGILADLNGELIIGEAMTLSRNVQLKPDSNFLIAEGKHISEDAEAAGESAVFFAMYSLLMEKLNRPEKNSIHCVNCADMPGRLDDEREKDFILRLANRINGYVNYGNCQTFNEALTFFTNQMERRKNDRSLLEKEPALWWFLLKPELISNVFQEPRTCQQFENLLREAKDYNIRIVLWTRDSSFVKDQKQFFPEKLLLEMESTDVKNVLGNDLQKNPEKYKALLVGRNNVFVSIYHRPMENWVDRLADRINSRKWRKP